MHFRLSIKFKCWLLFRGSMEVGLSAYTNSICWQCFEQDRQCTYVYNTGAFA